MIAFSFGKARRTDANTRRGDHRGRRADSVDPTGREVFSGMTEEAGERPKAVDGGLDAVSIKTASPATPNYSE
jgi:hypothetical protein